jgi:hypothetical protein
MKFYFVKYHKRDKHCQVYCEDHSDRQAGLKQLTWYQANTTLYSYKEVPVSCIKRMYGMAFIRDDLGSRRWLQQFPLPIIN